MKKILLTTLSMNLLATTLFATSVRDVVVRTLDSNSDILSEKFNKEAYKKYVDEEKGDYYPTLDLDSYLEKSTTRYNRDDEPNDPSTASKDGWNSALKLEQVLYDGGTTPSEVEGFRHRYNSNKFRSDRRVSEITRTSIDSYINLVKYQELMNSSENNIKVHDSYLIIAQDKEKISGEILESYQVNSKKHSVTDTFLSQKLEKTAAYNKFVEFTNQEITGNICRPIINENLIPKTMQIAIEEAVQNNTKILEAIEDIKEQRENIVQANAANLPSLKFQWQKSWDDDLSEEENGREDIDRLRLILSWNLYEGGKTKISKDREKLFLFEKQKILDNVTNEVIQEVKTSYTNYFDLKIKIENMKKFVDDNKNIKDVYLKQLEDGTRTFIDILNAEAEYFRSDIDRIEQEFELYSIYYDLLSHRNILIDSILMSNNQVCKKFIPHEYKGIKDNTKAIGNTPVDIDVLKELGEDIDDTDLKINNLINGIDVEDKNKKEDKKIEEEVLPSGKYTIHLSTLDENDDYLRFISKHNLDSDKVYKYNLNNNIKVIYGSYNTLEEASTVINKLDEELIDEGVYVDSLEKHRKILEKLKTIN
jgi:adhesin transport system outer membrane protein